VITHDIDHLQQVAKAGEPIVDAWRDHGITVFGPGIREILGHTKPDCGTPMSPNRSTHTPASGCTIWSA